MDPGVWDLDVPPGAWANMSKHLDPSDRIAFLRGQPIYVTPGQLEQIRDLVPMIVVGEVCEP